MRWKELLIGAALTLIVTVIGGLLVYFFTQEKAEPKSEVLTYQLDRQVSFEGNNNLLSIGVAKFSNIGNEPAKDVVVEFKTNSAEVIEFKTESQGGAEIFKSTSVDKHLVTLKIKNLLPDELISVTYLLNKPSEIEFLIRSEKTIGKEGPIYKNKTERKSILNNFLGDYVPLLIILLVMSFPFIVRYLSTHMSRGAREGANKSLM